MTKLVSEDAGFTTFSTCQDILNRKDILEKLFSPEQALKWQDICKGTFRSSVEKSTISKTRQKSLTMEMNFGVRCLHFRHVRKILNDLMKILKERITDKEINSFE